MEVIDLLSSSPPRAAVTQVKHDQKSHKTEILKDIFDFSSDGLSALDDLTIPVDHRSKKRKVTHSPLQQLTVANGNGKSKHDFIFDLLSDTSSSPCAQELPSPHLKATTQTANVVDATPWSSSAPEPQLQPVRRSRLILDLSSDTEGIENNPIQASSQPCERPKPIFSQQTANLLANIRGKTSSANVANKFGATIKHKPLQIDGVGSDRFKKAAHKPIHDSIESSQPDESNAAIAKTKQSTVVGTQTKSFTQKKSKEEKQAEKEIERQRKQQEKEERQREKQRAADIAEVNKSKTNKKNSTPEMIIEIPSSLKESSLCNQVEEYMKELGVQINYSSGLMNDVNIGIQEARSGSIVTWRRKVTAEYNEDHEIWQPLAQPRVSNEDQVLIYLKAEEFVRLAVVSGSRNVTSATDVSEETMMSNIDTHVRSLRQRYPQGRLLYLIEGLSAWLKKSINAKNRAYTAAVRAQTLETDRYSLDDSDANDADGTNPPPSTQPRTKTSTARRKKTNNNTSQIDFSSINESTTEALLLHMQLHHQPLQVHHTTSPKTSAAQISTFTQHLSTRPYRLAAQSANLASASFCMTTGQIRTGTNASETWLQMLQEINRVTPSMAYGIVGAGYTNPAELVKAFRRDGRLMLEDVRKSTNKDGGWSDRRLGPMVSKRIHKVFMGTDPTAMDGMA